MRRFLSKFYFLNNFNMEKEDFDKKLDLAHMEAERGLEGDLNSQARSKWREYEAKVRMWGESEAYIPSSGENGLKAMGLNEPCEYLREQYLGFYRALGVDRFLFPGATENYNLVMPKMRAGQLNALVQSMRSGLAKEFIWVDNRLGFKDWCKILEDLLEGELKGKITFKGWDAIEALKDARDVDLQKLWPLVLAEKWGWEMGEDWLVQAQGEGMGPEERREVELLAVPGGQNGLDSNFPDMQDLPGIYDWCADRQLADSLVYARLADPKLGIILLLRKLHDFMQRGSKPELDDAISLPMGKMNAAGEVFEFNWDRDEGNDPVDQIRAEFNKPRSDGMDYWNWLVAYGSR